ncbi:hypothetical protein M514_04909 [Trichuris suis]|uniref:Uncharacterized protein n=1 Tax=Trichuris suis TaxID=68888 RepID=A0A085NP51_9BILA|nr:hypothetical protein M514_04909 [Trichuris suis]KHJ48285.1 hypothetical protein D918_01553 [Trichuris suis]
MADRLPYWQKYRSAERSFTIAAGLNVLNKSLANQRLKEVNRELVTELNVLKEEIAKSKAEIRRLENENVRIKNEIARLERQKRAKLSRHPVRKTEKKFSDLGRFTVDTLERTSALTSRLRQITESFAIRRNDLQQTVDAYIEHCSSDDDSRQC